MDPRTGARRSLHHSTQSQSSATVQLVHTHSLMGLRHSFDDGTGGAGVSRFTRDVRTEGGHRTETEEYLKPAEVQPRPKYDNPARQNYPAYVGARGTLYNLDYLPVGSTYFAEEHAEDVYDIDRLKHAVPSAAEARRLLGSMPEPKDHRSYDEYEAALVAWKAAVAKALSYVRMPTVCARTLSRPRINEDPAAAPSSDAPDDQSAAAPPPPPAATAPSQQPQQQPHEVRVNAADPWSAALVPPEPNPLFYEDYDQYELALQRWQVECCRTMATIVPHVAQLQTFHTVKIRASKAAGAADDALDSGAASKPAEESDGDGAVPRCRVPTPYAADSAAWAPSPVP